VEKKLVLRGVLAGAFAGLLAFVFARIFAESQIQKAIDYESARDSAQDALNRAAGIAVVPEGSDIFSRSVQANIGIGVGMIAFGAAMGALFAVAYTVCLGRVGALKPRTISLAVAAAGFLGIYLVPFIKYPANPPAIGHEDTIRQRGALYLAMVGCAVVFLIGAVVLGQWLRHRFGNWNASLIAGGAYVAVITVVMLVLPSFGELAFNKANFGHHATETPLPLKDADGNIVFPGFPADVLFNFRLYSVGAQLLLWTTLGLVFAPLAERVLAPELVRGAAASSASESTGK
jgi:hypothetical protein